jgi:predicted transcriptional regulator
VKKQHVLDLVRDMPEEFDSEELVYRLYVLHKIEEGEEAIRAGRVISQAEAKRRISEWLQ